MEARQRPRSTADQHFEGALQNAKDTISGCEHTRQEAGRQFGEEIQWEIRHGWRAERLHVIEAELAEIGHTPKGPPSGRSAPSRPALPVSRRDMAPHAPEVPPPVRTPAAGLTSVSEPLNRQAQAACRVA